MLRPGLNRHGVAAVGVLCVAIGVGINLAFFTLAGMAFLVAGFVLLAVAATREDGSTRDAAYPVLLLPLALLTALAPFYPGPPDVLGAALTVGGALFFYVAGIPVLRRYRLAGSGVLLVAAHAAFILHVGEPPHQDVYRFLNLGVDALLRGQDPYLVSTANGGPFKLTYPPGVLLLVAPFRVLFGDIRWAYVVAEGLCVALVPQVWRRVGGGRLERWQEALVLIPLVLPRTSQAFFVFSNHEWLLLALTLGVLVLALDRRWLAAGVVAGVGIATKQYFVVFPLLFLLSVVRWRSLLVAALVALAITLPFILWSPPDFFTDVFGNLSAAPDPDRLTLWALAANLGLNLGPPGSATLAAAGALVTMGLAWVSRRSLSASLLACGLALAAFTLGASFAGYNYYAYALVLCTWGLLLGARTARA
ncbi:MAG: hypothetical protein QOE92_1162 [Chloroflexota bacterium]|jgi:hypothetical protein|nr:hypothetical protein [Chloroflexota bacterium]